MDNQQLWMICTCDFTQKTYCQPKSLDGLVDSVKYQAYSWMSPFTVAVNLTTGEEVHVFQLPEMGGWCVTHVSAKIISQPASPRT